MSKEVCETKKKENTQQVVNTIIFVVVVAAIAIGVAIACLS